jgi:nitroreductase
MEANQVWCVRAAALMVVLSHKVFARDSRPNPVHTFDSGAAFENLALQGTAMGLVVHGMAGFDRGKARATLHVPEDYEVEAMVAVGHPGNPDDLPAALQQREVPTGRKPMREIICEGPFAF